MKGLWMRLMALFEPAEGDALRRNRAAAASVQSKALDHVEHSNEIVSLSRAALSRIGRWVPPAGRGRRGWRATLTLGC